MIGRYTFSNSLSNLTCRYNHVPYKFTHSHDYWEVFIVTDGVVEHKINGNSHFIEKNTVCLIRPNDTHCLLSVNGSPSSHINIEVRDSFINRHLDMIDKSLYETLKAPDYIEVTFKNHVTSYIIENTCYLQTLQKNEPTYNKTLSLLFFDILHNILHILDIKNTAQTQYPDLVKKAVEAMYNPQNFGLSIEEICKLLSCSYSHFIRLFKKHIGVTPVLFFQKIKMDHALSLLTWTDDSIFSISNIVGFSNVWHFNTLFKKLYGVPPAKYKKTWRQSGINF